MTQPEERKRPDYILISCTPKGNIEKQKADMYIPDQNRLEILLAWLNINGVNLMKKNHESCGCKMPLLTSAPAYISICAKHWILLRNNLFHMFGPYYRKI